MCPSKQGFGARSASRMSFGPLRSSFTTCFHIHLLEYLFPHFLGSFFRN